MTQLVRKSVSFVRRLVKRSVLKLGIARPLSKWYPGILPSLIQQAIDAGDYEAAVELGREFLAHKPESGKALKHLARSLDKAGRSREALDLIEKQFQSHAPSKVLCKSALEIARRIGDHQSSILWAKRLVELDQSNVRAFDVLGQYYCQAQDDIRLSELLKRFVPTTVSGAFSAVKLAFLMLRVGEHDSARELLTVARNNKSDLFRLLVAQIACEISANEIDSAVALGRQLLSNEDETRRAYFVYLDLVLMINDSVEGKEKYARDQALFESRMEDLLSQPQSPAYTDWLRVNREHVAAIRNTRKSAELLAEQPITVSYICPIHRAVDLPNAIAQISHQSWKNGEAVFGINGGGITPEQIKASWQSDIALKIVDCNDLDRVGPVLNRAISHSAGEVMIRIDADNLYMPDYAADAVLSLEHFEADMIGQKVGYRLFKEDDIVLADPSKMGFFKATHGEHAGGGSLCFRKSLCEELSFSDTLRRGEDTVFVTQSIGKGLSFYFVGPFNYVSVRSSEARNHTWDISRLELLLIGSRHILGTQETVFKDVEFAI